MVAMSLSQAFVSFKRQYVFCSCPVLSCLNTLYQQKEKHFFFFIIKRFQMNSEIPPVNCRSLKNWYLKLYNKVHKNMSEIVNC